MAETKIEGSNTGWWIFGGVLLAVFVLYVSSTRKSAEYDSRYCGSDVAMQIEEDPSYTNDDFDRLYDRCLSSRNPATGPERWD